MNFNAINIGSVAWQVISHDQSASVMGVTSRGIFIRAAARVIFVSFENYRGPLTITLNQTIDQLSQLAVGDPAVFSNARLIFPTIETTIVASTENVWQALLPTASPCPIEQQRRVLKQIAAGAIARRSDVGFAPLLAALLGLPSTASLSADQMLLLNVLHSVPGNDLATVLNSIHVLIGRGNGLTPSGDDVVLGLLLMLNRWAPEIDRMEFNRAVIDQAYRRTTTISANLIECAADGQADERLITIVDGIATGSASIDECIANVLSWGSSSGLDALLGMALAIVKA